MHRVASAGNTSNLSRPRKEKRLTYVINHADNTKHCAGINCLAIVKPTHEFLFTGSRDGTIKRWKLDDDEAIYSATFESHTDWVNDAVLTGNALVSCSSDTSLKIWDLSSNGTCTKTLRQHTDYVTCLATAENNNNIVASGALGGEVFIWDIEAASNPVAKSADATEDESSNGFVIPGNSSLPFTNFRPLNAAGTVSGQNSQSFSYTPTSAKGHKESVYALAMNDTGKVLVSGGTEKVLRVWDPRTGTKNMKLRGHTDNIRALLLDSTGRYCISGSSDAMIRLWDLGQQRCVHSYAVHTDSVWALSGTPTFTHVYSGGRDRSVYLTDLSTRESVLLCMEEHPVLEMTMQDDNMWVATTDSAVHKWPVECRNPQKVLQGGGLFLAGNLSFSRARAYSEGSTPVPINKRPVCTIPGIPGVLQHEVLNNRRHVLTKDSSGSVKLWDITRGLVIEDYGEVSYEEKKEKLFEMVSIPAWFTMDTRLGCLSVHLDTPQCFSAEMYAVDLGIQGAPEDQKVNLAQETLRSLFTHWSARRRQKNASQASANGDGQQGRDAHARNIPHSRPDIDDGADKHNAVYPAFEFSTASPPSISTEGSCGGPWRKRITTLEGTEDEKDIPRWCLDCVLNGRIPPRENTKCSFYLQPCEGSSLPVLTQGKLSAPRILRINKLSWSRVQVVVHVSKVINYVVEKLVLDRPVDSGNLDGPFGPGGGLSSVGDGSFRSGLKPWQKLRPSIEILCNNQVLSSDLSLATVKTYIWKKPEDLVLNYRDVQAR